MISDLTTIESLFLSYRDGIKKPHDVVAKFLEKIESRNAYYSAYQSVWKEEAMVAAELATKALAAGHDLGPLHGVPFALKDIFHVTGKVTTCGAVELNQNIATVTATVVRRLVSAGAIILGKTKTVECAFGGWGTNQMTGTPAIHGMTMYTEFQGGRRLVRQLPWRLILRYVQSVAIPVVQ